MTTAASPLEPDRATLERWLALASRFVADHVDHLATAPASGPIGREAQPIVTRVAAPIPEDPSRDMADLLGLLAEAAEASIRTNGPGYLAYIPGGGLPTAAIAELLAGVTNRFTGLAATAPALVRLENDVLAWLAAEFGYGPSAKGWLTSGGSIANLAAIVTARHARLGDDGDLRHALVYTSDQVHHSVAKGVRLAGVPSANVRAVPVDGRLRMRPEALDAMLSADRGRRPFLVVANAGTTNTGAVDPLDAIADLCAAHGVWMHVDGAYGGAFVLCPEGRARLAGIARADSITFDPHKGMFLPYGTGCVLVRDGDRLAEAHRGTAAYLQDIAAGDSPSDHGAELSRPYRGLRLWLPLQLHGARAFRDALSEKLALAEVAWRGLEALGFEILHPPDLSIVAFRLPRRAGEALAAWDARNEAMLQAILARGHVWMSSTRIDGRFVLRVCVLSFRTHRDRIDALLDDARAALAAY